MSLETVPLDQEYPIGTAGVPWGAAEKQQWLAAQSVKRSYAKQVLEPLKQIVADHSASVCLEQYGELHYPAHDADKRFPLMAVRSSEWQSERKTIIVTGGVHGYETSGVHGALRFIETELAHYAAYFNVLVAPCISPWGYETINRWNPNADDPNRSFYRDKSTPESAAIMAYIDGLSLNVLSHIDLHETTDTDNSEFRPALGALKGIVQEVWDIPDGFYAVGDTLKPAPEFQKAIIDSVAKVTHIAPADEHGKLIGEDLEQFGVINYATKELGLCAGFTNADFVSTTEVYPDSPKVDDENCIVAQVAALKGGFDYLLGL